LTPAQELAEKNERNRAERDPVSANQLIPSSDDTLKKPATQTSAMTAVPSVCNVNLGVQALAIQKQSLEGLMQLMRQLGAGYSELSKFNCRKAIQIFQSLPLNHNKTGWVLGQLGRAHFELGEYKDAKMCFKDLREREPFRLENMEYYSTALWHLQEEVELSALSQELTRADKTSAQGWCAAGNCFSLLKEHENAIKFFKRAGQIDPNFAYAYTLLGHEYVMIEELDQALVCFRTAVRLDPRHYNAWYGVGLTYYKQERYQLAEMYYRKALAINPNNAVLMCHVAVVQHAMQKTEKALETLNSAIKNSPNNILCRFERASILFSAERYPEALEELNELKVMAPKESPVYFMLGKVSGNNFIEI
jgi:anaphase-promoting complex subunit 3